MPVHRYMDTGQTDTRVKTEDTLTGFQQLFPSSYHQESVQYNQFCQCMYTVCHTYNFYEESILAKFVKKRGKLCSLGMRQ